ncbi:hypothetical protein FOA52_012230 [Chlamydomonas sp. UWO 241]|nr:hypothetical protein FOA52_012230 [Chlamydomonas sp. UWO 241]
MVEVLRTDWKAIRSNNLGVKSGSGVRGDVTMQKLHQWVQELHTLCITEGEAAAAVGRCARRMPPKELQQLQMMLDAADHSELSDFVRVLVFNVSDLFATAPVDILRPYSHLASSSPRAAAGTASSPRGGASAAAGGSDGGDTVAGALPGCGRRPQRDEFIRFAGYLPEGHKLSATAQALYESRRPPVPHSAAEDGSDQGEDAGAVALRRYPLRDVLGPCDLIKAIRGEGPPPPEQTYPDIQRTWREKTHTVNRDPLLDAVTMGDPVLAYSRVPEVRVRAAALAAAAALVRAERAAVEKGSSRRTREGSARSALGAMSRESSRMLVSSMSGIDQGSAGAQVLKVHHKAPDSRLAS